MGWFMCRVWLVRSATVSVAVQKSGGELVQPIGRASGKAISGGWPCWVGNVTPKAGMCLGARWIW